MFRSTFAEDIFNQKYRHDGCETWPDLAYTLVKDVCGGLLRRYELDTLVEYIRDMKFIPGGRYLYYAGRSKKFFNNCYLLRAEEDTREDWAELAWKATSCLMTGGGIGIDYSRYRGRGALLKQTGGEASGPIPAMKLVNEIGRNVMQGGSRRSALYASLDWSHPDIGEFMTVKNWDHEIRAKKEQDYSYPATLDCTNISVNYKDEFLAGAGEDVFRQNVRQAMMTGDPGFSFNFGEKRNETLRNACTEVTSSDDSDVCNLGSVNMGRISSISEFDDVCRLGTLFLLCGTLKANLPYPKVYQVRKRNRRLGLGLMGLHEWLLRQGQPYDPMNPILRTWMGVYAPASSPAAEEGARWLAISTPVAVRAVAPTGTIGILAGTTTGLEPIYAVAYKRRYLKGTRWHEQYVMDSVAERLIEELGVSPESIETSLDLAISPEGVERRIAMQAMIQDHVDQGISSTINLPAWGSTWNNEDLVDDFAEIVKRYAPRLRGLTMYPDGARGGQPLTSVPYWVAKQRRGEAVEVRAHDVCDITGKGGTCGV